MKTLACRLVTYTVTVLIISKQFFLTARFLPINLVFIFKMVQNFKVQRLTDRNSFKHWSRESFSHDFERMGSRSKKNCFEQA